MTGHVVTSSSSVSSRPDDQLTEAREPVTEQVIALPRLACNLVRGLLRHLGAPLRQV